MARAVSMDLPPALGEVEEESTESTEELLPRRKDVLCSHSRAAAVALAFAAFAACAMLAVVGMTSAAGANAPSAAKSLTVRQLLEGHELAEAMTDNFMNLGHGYLHPSRRGEVRSAVAANLANISGSIRSRLPADHAQMEVVQLSEEQKGSVLRLLRHYSDPRVLRLGNAIAEASAEAKAEANSRRSLKTRLAEKLQPHLRELKELCDDIVPGSGEAVDLRPEDFEDLAREHEQTMAEKWHVKVEVDAPKAASSAGLLAARRLTARDTSSGTRDQATVVLQHLHGMLGETMPSAPARMLMFDKQKEYEQQTTGWERFQTCVMDNMSSLPKLFECLMSNCSRAMNWLIKKFHLSEFVDKFTSAAASQR